LTYLGTGLSHLDKLLGGHGSDLGGVSQGQVTEVWGPSGAGKTALG
jgi:RecA/RadA recombinase